MSEIPAGLDEFLAETPAPSQPELIAPISTNGTQTAPVGAASTPELPSAPAGLDDFLHEELQQEKYGTPSQQALAGIEGIAKGIAGPLATGAERLAGVDPEGIRGREEANPWTHGIGEAAGFGGSLFTGVGEAALVGKVGEAAAKAAGLAEGANAFSQIGAKALQAATELGLIQAGDETSKAITLDPNQSVQSAVTNVGLSALLGGAGGALLGSVSPLWKATQDSKLGQEIANFKGRLASKAANPEPLETFKGELGEFYNTTRGAVDETFGPVGLKADAIAKSVPALDDKILTQASENASKLQDEVYRMQEAPGVYPARLTNKLEGDLANYNSVIMDPAATSGEIFNATQDLKQTMQGYAKFEKRIAPFDESFDFVRDAKGIAHDLRVSLEDQKVWGQAGQIQESMNKAFSKYIKPLKDFEKKFTTELNGERVIDPGKINTYMNQLGKPNAEIKQEALDNFLKASEKYRETIADVHASIGAESPLLPSSLAHVKDTLQEVTPGMRLADMLAEKAGGTILGAGAGAYLGDKVGIGHEAGAALGVYALGPSFSKILPSLTKMLITQEVSGVGLKAASDLSHAIVSGDNLITKAAKNIFKTGAAILPENLMPSEKDRQKLDKLLQKYQTNPLPLTAVSGSSGHYMPEHAAAIGQVAARTTQYLNSLRPVNSPKNPLDTVIPPSQMQKAAYNHALDIANQPLLVLKQIKDGTITPENIKHLNSMYPDLYKKISQSVTNEMADHLAKGETIPYKTRIGMSMFLTQPMDSTMTPQGIMGAQPVPVQPNQPQGPQTPGERPKHSMTALNKLPGQYQTRLQSRQSNRD